MVQVDGSIQNWPIRCLITEVAQFDGSKGGKGGFQMDSNWQKLRMDSLMVCRLKLAEAQNGREIRWGKLNSFREIEFLPT